MLVIAVLAAGYVAFARSPELQELVRPETVRAGISRLGAWGPAVLIVGMALAIVFSPIPSAPIALAAGALYGHAWGTVYAVIGAEIGALIAFGLARILGRPFVARMLTPGLLDEGAWGSRSEWMIASGVLVARLFPFISFDAVSYLAGITHLRTWLFAGVTLIGMLPMTFLFSHFGATMTAADEPLKLLNLLAALGLVGLLWLGWRLWRSRQ